MPQIAADGPSSNSKPLPPGAERNICVMKERNQRRVSRIFVHLRHKMRAQVLQLSSDLRVVRVFEPLDSLDVHGSP